jgi:hypothetical protein
LILDRKKFNSIFLKFWAAKKSRREYKRTNGGTEVDGGDGWGEQGARVLVHWNHRSIID